MGLGLGLRLGLRGVRVLGAAGPIYDPDAASWFAAVKASGSVFVPGAEDAYNKFFVQAKADGNLAPFGNGLLLAFAGFTGLGGCFVPLKSRPNVVVLNDGFVSGHKSTNFLTGNGTASIGTGILNGDLFNQNTGCLVAFIGAIGSPAGILLGSGAFSTSSSVLGGGAVAISSVSEFSIRSGSSVLTHTINPNTLALLQNRAGGHTVLTNGAIKTDDYGKSNANGNYIRFFSGADLSAPYGTVFNTASCSAGLMGCGSSLPNPSAFDAAVSTLMTDLGVV